MEESYTIGLWGEDKSGKSTFALSAPKPLQVLEIDVGGFIRACRNLPNLPIKDWYEAGEIRHKEYTMPIQGISMGKDKQIVFTNSKVLTGIKELFYQFVTDYFRALTDPEIRTVVIDTGTLLYNTLITDGYLQELQEKQLEHKKSDPTDKKELRTSLIQIEYKEPYDRMRGIVYQAKAHHKNLIMTHHATDEYKPMPDAQGRISTQATGKRRRHGWEQLGDSVDFMLQCYVKDMPVLGEDGKAVKPAQNKRLPFAKVELSNVLEIVGQEFQEPTFDMLINTVKMIRGES